MLKSYKCLGIAAIAAISLLSSASAQKACSPNAYHYQLASHARDGEDYMSKTVIFKMKNDYRSLCSNNDISNAELKVLMQQMGVQSFGKIYPREHQPEREFNPQGIAYADLSLIYEYTYTANMSLQQAMDKIASLGITEYAVPHVIPHIDYTVNDPQAGSQWQIAKIKADQAWSISQGDPSVVIGITDTGTELTHPDLAANMQLNPADPINGTDDDNDGFIDNYHGYDVGSNDNDPTWQGDAHGVHCTGIADAVTDNSTGVAGIGFKCHYLPVKIADATGKLIASYYGIYYAAAHGCKVISCSWGGTVDPGTYGQDIINFATINNDALVVSAAGNSGLDEKNWPSSNQYVMRVAWLGTTDAKDASSDYGNDVSICAPGTNILSTYSGGSYSTLSGTSMACPVVAGSAAIVRSYFPSYTALQTAARLKVTADNIDAINGTALKGKLGSGRVNLYRALTDPGVPSISMTSRTLTDNNDNAIVANDTIRITGTFTNYLANSSSNLKVVLSTTSTFVTLQSTTSTLGAINTLGSTTNASSVFKVKVKSTAPLNTPVIFKLTYTDGTYTAIEYFELVVNVDYLNVNVNNIATSVTSRGMIGWNNDPPTQGLGFEYKGTNLTYEGGLMIGVPDSAVSNTIRGVKFNAKNYDFNAVFNARRVSVNPKSDFDTEAKFNDGAAQQPLPILVHQKTYAWSAPADANYVIWRYVITNTGTKTLSGLYAGIGADFDIQGKGGDSNRVGFDATNKMGYTYYTKTKGLYAGIKLLTSTAPVNVYGIDNDTTGSGGVDVFHNGFSRAEKYITLSTMRAAAGVAKQGQDVLEVVSTGPYTINAGDSIDVAFALIGSDDLAMLQTSAVAAQTRYDNTILSAPAIAGREEAYTLQFFPNPTSGNTIIDVNLPKSGKMELKVYNMIGQDVATISSGDQTAGNHQFNFDASKLNSGVYYYQLTAGETKLVRRLIVSK